MDGFLVGVSEMFISPAAWLGLCSGTLSHGARGSLATPGNTKEPLGNEAEQGQGNAVPPLRAPLPGAHGRKRAPTLILSLFYEKEEHKYKLDSDYDFIILQRRWVAAGNKACYLPESLKIQTICN